MGSTLLRRVIVPVATEDDARLTFEAIQSHFDDEIELHVVHVIEKAGGAPDKAPLEARRKQAQNIFEIAEDAFEGTEDELTTDLRYGTSVTDEIVAAADERDATAIAFLPRPSGKITRLLTGNRTQKLVSTTLVPVVVLPRPREHP